MLPDRLDIILHAAWPASQVAAEILESHRRFYGDALDIAGVQREMQKIWVTLQQIFTEEERLRIGDITHVSVPMNDLSASINRPPSQQGYFVLFDAMLDLRIWEIFTVPRNEVAWAAAYVRAAWGRELRTARWVEPATKRLQIGRGGAPAGLLQPWHRAGLRLRT